MAFPVNGVLDAFTRADASTLGANWSSFFADGANSGNQAIVSNQLYQQHGGFSNYTGMYWNPSTFGADSESYFTIVTKPNDSSNDKPVIMARIRQPGNSTYDSYGVTYFDSNGGVFIQRADNSVGTQLGATISQANNNGDKIGIEIIGSTISAYYNTGSGWTNIGSRVDATYADAGYIGFYIPGNTTNGRFDDFGGGTIASAVTRRYSLTTLGVG